MRRFLKYELDRYLSGRGTEQKGEQPLLRADGAAYVHYQKGAHVLYALQDAIGEAAMNDALSAFVKRWRFKGPPYATSRDLHRGAAPRDAGRAPGADRRPLFENITFYDDRAVKAEARKRPDGKYDVDARRHGEEDARRRRGQRNRDAARRDARHRRAGREGQRSSRSRSGASSRARTSSRCEVDGEPARAGIDPLNKLIDRDAGDNMTDVTKQ